MQKLPSFLAAFFLSLPAWADEPVKESGEPAPLDEEWIGPWDHLDVSMGFIAGGRSYKKTNFSLDEGEVGLGMLPALDFAPFDAVNIYGLRYEVRQVVSYLRMSAALDIPFPSYAAKDTEHSFLLNGEERTLTVRSVSPWELRFGIGAEYPIGAVAPYVDLIGGIHWVDATLATGDQESQFDATEFAFSARGGLRLHVRRWFFATASGEVGLAGDIKWGAELSIGFALL